MSDTVRLSRRRFLQVLAGTAGAYAANEGSARAFEKAGYRREARLIDHWWVDGGYQDGIYLAKVNREGSAA